MSHHPTDEGDSAMTTNLTTRHGTTWKCDAVNGPHACHLPTGHPGDHVCTGCHDRWNRGPWDDEAEPWDDNLWQGSTCLDDLNDHLCADEEANR
jgi:hypothetical protein